MKKRFERCLAYLKASNIFETEEFGFSPKFVKLNKSYWIFLNYTLCVFSNFDIKVSSKNQKSLLIERAQDKLYKVLLELFDGPHLFV